MTFLTGLEKEYYIVDREYQIIQFSEEAKGTYPAMEVGAYCYECITGRDRPCHNCPVRSLGAPGVLRFDTQRGKLLRTYAFPVPGQDGCEQFLVVSGEQKEEGNSQSKDGANGGADTACDMLTGLPGRDGLFRCIAKQVPKQGITYCMLVVDIEHFHFINKWFGRETGDRMLASIGRFLKETDSIFGTYSGYFGGDNFCICMVYNEDAVAHIRRGVIDIVSRFEDVSGFRPMFGGYCYSDLTMALDECYDYCLTAISHVVDNAQSDIEWFDEEMIRDQEAEIELMPKIKQALKNKEFIVYLQPKCQMQTGKIVGAEALVRWNHPVDGIISPGKFIPTLEKNGYIAKLDRYVWECVFAMIKRWQQEGRRFVPVSVNVSRVDIFSMDVAQVFLDLLQKYQIPVSSIEIEITESAYADNEEIIHDVEQRLRESGFRILLDDFGSGYSALNMLKDIDIDIIKLDMKFFQMDGANTDRGINIINGIMRMARQLDLPVIAEGIETAKQCEILDMVGCSYAQGYYFYKPMPVPAFERLTEDESKLASIGSIAYVNRKQDRSYLNDILEYFWKVAEVNLKTGEYRFIRAIQEADYIHNHRADTIEEYITRYISHGRIHPDDIKRYRMTSDRDNILKNIEQGENRNRCAVRYKQEDNSYQWIIFEAMKLPDYSEENPNVLFTWKEADSKTATNEDAMEIVRQTFRTIVKINLNSGHFKVIEDRDGELPATGDEVTDLISWAHSRIAGGYVHSDDVQRLAQFVNPKAIYKHFLKKSSTMRLRYRQKRDGVFNWELLELAPSVEFTPENPVIRLYIRDLTWAYGDKDENEQDYDAETKREPRAAFEERKIYDLLANVTKNEFMRNNDIIAWETGTGVPRKPFSEQVKILADDFVIEEYRADFLRFFDRGRIVAAFENHDTEDTFEYRLLVNGKQLWIRANRICYRKDGSGDIMASFHFENVDSIKRLELMAQEKRRGANEKQLSFTVGELLQSMPGGFFVYRADPSDEEILFVNDEVLRLYGCSSQKEFDKLTGGHFAGMVHPDDYKHTRKQIAEQLDSSTSDKISLLDAVVYRIVCKDGSVLSVQNFGRLINHEEYGEVYCVFMSEIVDEQLLEAQFKYHVQSHLYDAYQKPEGFIWALKDIANECTAKAAFLLRIENACITEAFFSTQKGEEVPGSLQHEVMDLFMIRQGELESDRLFFYSVQERDEALKKYGVSRLVALPVYDNDNALVGVLGITLEEGVSAKKFMLRSVAKSFIMALNHRDAYRMIHKMGTQDILTGMKNRNSYEQAVKAYKKHEKNPLGCIYIDANGLHELNNEHGHEAGDLLLKSVADEMKMLFGADNCYRVGGDEFIILTDLDTPEVIEKKLQVLEQHLLQHDYYISYGYSWTPALTNFTKLVRDAERQMYECKRAFYSGPPNGRRIEDKLLQKTDEN